eukprot:TRINITY_DN3560_c0_g1_i1.p1 TRINITY_DN3560_c0_g1~~TRINITY_DN3560_c0_g1_i1.p1  ORF type:complete len:393 (+),score=74.12 TRINITY_DN3560_c0_g1_i1:39-1217(+)
MCIRDSINAEYMGGINAEYMSVGIERMDKEFGNLISPYDNIKDMLLISYREIEYAIAKEDMGFIIKKVNEGKAAEVIEMTESEKFLIESVNKSIATLLDLQEFDLLEEGLNELLAKSQAYFTQCDPQLATQNVYAICELQAECSKLCQYNIQANKLLPCITVPKWCTIVQVAGKVFISGGYNPIINALYEFKETTKTLTSRQGMKHAKYDHRAEAVFANEFIIVGGHNGTSSIPHCDAYSIIQNKWTALPSLNKSRHNTATALLSSRYLYAIGGCNTNGEIEVLDVVERSAWKELALEVSEMTLNGSPAAFAVSSAEIVILKDGSNEAGILNTSDSTLKKYKENLKSDFYYCNPVCAVGKKVYTLGATKGHLFTYDIGEQQFTIHAYESICP